MRRLAVIGYPIKHSVSPAMQQAALDALGVESEYVAVEVAPEDLAAFVDEVRAGEWAGVNVTVPHKEAMLPLMDEISPEARAIGAVNTVVPGDGRLVGHNTDARGFLRALREDAGFTPAGKRVALLGAGGAARAVLWSLCDARAGSVLVINRDLGRAERLVASAIPWESITLVQALPRRHDSHDWRATLRGCDLVVNATSVGLHADDSPVPTASLPERALVVDLIYNPRPSRLLAGAAARGMRTLDGLPMLVYQGAAAFEMWTGMSAPTDVMMRAAERALESR